MSELALNLRKLRGQLSQSSFAKMIGVKQQTYANYELGTREPDIDTLMRIAKVTGKSVDELVGMKTMTAENATDKIADLKHAIITLLKQY